MLWNLTIVRPCQRDEDSAGVQGRCVGHLRPSALLPASPPADPLPAAGQAGPGGGSPPVEHCQLLSWPAQMRQLEDWFVSCWVLLYISFYSLCIVQFSFIIIVVYQINVLLAAKVLLDYLQPFQLLEYQMVWRAGRIWYSRRPVVELLPDCCTELVANLQPEPPQHQTCRTSWKACATLCQNQKKYSVVF